MSTRDQFPSTVTAYRFFKNHGIVCQQWTLMGVDDGDPYYQADAVYPNETIDPEAYLFDLFLTEEAALLSAIEKQREVFDREKEHLAMLEKLLTQCSEDPEAI